MTNDDIMSVAEYIGELYGKLERAKAETESVERAYGRLTDEVTQVDDERHSLLEECATLEAENVRLVERVSRLEKARSWLYKALTDAEAENANLRSYLENSNL